MRPAASATSAVRVDREPEDPTARYSQDLPNVWLGAKYHAGRPHELDLKPRA